MPRGHDFAVEWKNGNYTIRCRETSAKCPTESKRTRRTMDELAKDGWQCVDGEWYCPGCRRLAFALLEESEDGS